jgi:transcription elongation factor Elf1
MGYNEVGAKGLPTERKPTMDTTKRCDACGAQAYVSVVLNSTGQLLLFCGNHWERVKPKLEPVAAVDDSYLVAMREEAQKPKMLPVDA